MAHVSAIDRILVTRAWSVSASQTGAISSPSRIVVSKSSLNGSVFNGRTHDHGVIDVLVTYLSNTSEV